jgi:hypothetical protein
MATGIDISKQIAILDEGIQITPNVNQINFTGTGITATASGNDVTVNVVGATGVWGISDSAGVYTFYSTLTLAMTAAVAGQTIEMFADVTETGAVTITLKNEVTINGNGHTYSHNNNTIDLHSFQTVNSINTTCNIFNLNIVKSNSAASCLYLGINTTGTILLTGSKFNQISTGRCIGNFANSNVEIIDFVGFSNSGNCIQIGSSPTARVRNAYAYSNSGNGIFGNFILENSIGASNTSSGIYNSSGRMSNSIGVSSSNFGIQSIGGVLDNCKGYSSGSAGIYALYCNIYFCFGYSTASIGINMDNDPTNAYNCLGHSTVNYGIASSSNFSGAQKNLYNCTAISDANIAMLLAFGTNNNAINCTVISKWNNVGGHGIRVTGANNQILQCAIEVTNASANAINATTALTTKYANNSFKGSTTPINANITQGVTNTHDNQGNILI